MGYLLLILAILLTCCLDALRLTFGCYWRNSVTHLMLLTLHLGYQFLIQRWLGWVGSLHLIEFWVGVDHNGITHLATHPKLQKILPHTCTQIFENLEMPPIPKTVTAWHWWPLGLHNTSLDTGFSVHNFSFADQSNQPFQVLSSAVSLNWGKCPKYFKCCVTQLTVS